MWPELRGVRGMGNFNIIKPFFAISPWCTGNNIFPSSTQRIAKRFTIAQRGKRNEQVVWKNQMNVYCMLLLRSLLSSCYLPWIDFFLSEVLRKGMKGTERLLNEHISAFHWTLQVGGWTLLLLRIWHFDWSETLCEEDKREKYFLHNLTQ